MHGKIFESKLNRFLSTVPRDLHMWYALAVDSCLPSKLRIRSNVFFSFLAFLASYFEETGRESCSIDELALRKKNAVSSHRIIMAIAIIILCKYTAPIYS